MLSAAASIGGTCSVFPCRIPGSDASVLGELRGRLVKGGAGSLLFDRLPVLCREQGFLAQRGRQRTDSTHVPGAVRSLTRLACAIETLRTALDALAVAAPDWLHAHADTGWTERCERRGGDTHVPKADAARRAFAGNSRPGRRGAAERRDRPGRACMAARGAGCRGPAPRLGAEPLPTGRRCRPVEARQTTSPALAHRTGRLPGVSYGGGIAP